MKSAPGWEVAVKSIRHLGLLLGLLGTLAAATPPQDVARSQVLSVETDLVTLPVTVVDAHGGFVSGLRQEHFTVLDNGQRRTIQFFTNEDAAVTVGLVIDSSGSMRGRREQITAAATAFAGMSHPLDEFFTVNFNDVVWPGLPHSLAFTADQTQLRAALSAAPVHGMSALYDGIDRALEHLQLGGRDRKALIVVSDGGDNASTHSFEAVLEHARRNGVPIYAVTIFDPDDHDARPRVLKNLARATGGTSFAPRHLDDVASAFAQIARALRSGYIIGFLP